MAFCSGFGKVIAKHCHFSLTEVTVISFLIINKAAKVVCEVSLWYKPNYRYLGVLATPTRAINITRLYLQSYRALLRYLKIL